MRSPIAVVRPVFHRPASWKDADGLAERAAQIERWIACCAEALARFHAEHDARAEAENAMAMRVSKRRQEILRAAVQVPPRTLGSVLALDVGYVLAYFAACLELGVHVAVDRKARPRLEKALLDYEASNPDTADISWWHQLDHHHFDVDDLQGWCSCGQPIAQGTSQEQLARRARKLWDSGFGANAEPSSKPTGSQPWEDHV